MFPFTRFLRTKLRSFQTRKFNRELSVPRARSKLLKIYISTHLFKNYNRPNYSEKKKNQKLVFNTSKAEKLYYIARFQNWCWSFSSLSIAFLSQVMKEPGNNNFLLSTGRQVTTSNSNTKNTGLGDVIFIWVYTLDDCRPGRVCCYSNSQPLYYNLFYEKP